MTGTSIDGDLDAALVAVRGRGTDMMAEVVASRSTPLAALAEDLRRIASQEPLPALEFARIARAFGEVHALAIESVCSDAGVEPDLAVVHGQTVCHAPPISWQLLDPWPIAVRLKCRVRFDLRGANLASGGQGAPITPLADFVLFADSHGPKTVLNLGGFINATLLPTRSEGMSAIRGFDVCACNHLLDGVARTRLGAPFDADGAAAARGAAQDSIVEAVASALAPPTAYGRARRSLGTGDEAARLLSLTTALDPDDACRTVVEAVAEATARVLRDSGAAGMLLIAGGSARHRALHAALSRRTGTQVRTTEEWCGVAVGMREAAAMAVLGALADDGVRYSLPAVTGARSAVPESAVLEAAPREVAP